MFKKKLVAGLFMSALLSSAHAEAESIWSALKSGTPKVWARLRYEDVDGSGHVVPGATEDASDAQQLTLRTAVGYQTGSYMGFSAFVELEDISNVDDDDGRNVDNRYSDINEINLQYKTGGFSAKLGRQTIVHDGARHIGNVIWRQNDMTYDALTLKYTADKFNISYNYVWQLHRIFGDKMKGDHHWLRGEYNFGFLKAIATYYIADHDTDNDNNIGPLFNDDQDFDQYGLRLTGATKLSDSLKLIYTGEYASQSEGSDAVTEYEADYIFAELGLGFPKISAFLGYEELGSDDGVKSFKTPFATVHKFGGWADKFLGPQQVLGTGAGYQDTYLKLAGALAGIKMAAFYHELEADDDSHALADRFEGSEIDFVATYKTSFGPSFGAKFAFFDADEAGEDLDIMWFWTEYKI